MYHQQHRYTLEKGSKKHLCPRCHKKKFVRYLDLTNNNYIPEEYGRCDREAKCNYHLNPYQNGYEKEGKEHNYIPLLPPKPKPLVFFPTNIFARTLQKEAYEQNSFITNLLTNVKFPFEVADVEKVIENYYLGTVSKGYMHGATTFPFIDYHNKVRTVQIKQFDNKNHTTKTSFLHGILTKHYEFQKKPVPKWLEKYNKNELKVSCLFGEHLLSKYPYHTIGLVEAPKTAIYSTLYFGSPEENNMLWLAVFNLSSLTVAKCKVLKG